MKYSIITVNYNNKDGLRKTIESVIHQTFRDFEFIVIDGGNTIRTSTSGCPRKIPVSITA